MKTKLYIFLILAVIVGAVYFWPKNLSSPAINTGARSPLDATYIIEGKQVTLENGLSEIPADSGSVSKVITRYFGNDVNLDLDGDGREDSVFLLTQETGGSGTFYYVAAALNTGEGYIGSQALLLGDRIAPQTTDI